MSRSIRRAMIDRDHQQLSLVRQCILLDVSRASVYYRPVPTRAEDLELMALMDRQYLKTPFYGSRKMKAWLLQQGHLVSRKRVRRLMRLMGLEAIYRRPNNSKPAPGHRIFPYLLKCQGRWDVGPVGRSKSVPQEVIGQRKCPHHLFRRSVTEAGWQQAGWVRTASGTAYGLSDSSGACAAAFSRLRLRR